MVWVVGLSLDLLAYILETSSWAYLIWCPIFGVCAPFFLPEAEVRLMVGIGFLFFFPLAALIMRWLSRGLYGRKLGRIILVASLSGLFAVCSIAAAIFSRTISPWVIVPQTIWTVAVLAIMVAAIVLRKALLEHV